MADEARPRRTFGRSAAVTAAAIAAAVASGCVPSYTVTRGPRDDRLCEPSGSEGGSELTWYSPREAGDSRVLDAWCLAVGPPVVEASPTRPSSPLSPGDSVRIVSWNSNAGAGEMLAFLATELGFECESAALGSLQSSPHFVLLVQEAFRRSNDIPDTGPGGTIPKAVSEATRDTPRRGVVDIARTCGLSLVYVPAARNGSEPRDGLREDKGNAILSTLPLSDIAVIELPFEGARRVAVAATIRGPEGRRLRIASVHFLSMARPWRLLTTGNASRLREALALIDALRKIEGEESADGGAGAIPTIAGGDMNTWSSRETALQHLRQYFAASPPSLSEPTRGSFPTDHLFFRATDSRAGVVDTIEPASYRRLESTYNSDHHPIIVRFRWGDDGGR